MTPFVAELVGTCLIIILGEGVVANVVLAKTKGNGGGLIAITFGWAIAVFVGVFSTSAVSGAHLNPAVSIGLAMAGKFEWALVPTYILAQLLGAMLGSALVWIHYRQHLNETDDAATKLPVALVVLGIGLGLGGTTGYAINPARDLGPRMMHAILPIKGKGSSDWGYSWIPIVGPSIGAVLAALIFKALQ